jgi:pantoate--beta-alanine ligase
MIKVESVSGLRELLNDKKNIVFIPTMGNLHEGHLSLIDQATLISKTVVVSIFINPAQFNSSQDLEKYPRTIGQDIALLRPYENVIIFVPQLNEIYPETPNKNYDLPPMANELCGKYRPGHFNGVITVIDRLFNLIKPQAAIFGKKDYQQLYLIKEFSKVSYPTIEIIGMPTIRDGNGLALSSRNNLFEKEQLIDISFFNQSLTNIVHRAQSGENYQESILFGIDALNERGWLIDYIEVRRSSDLKVALPGDRHLIILGAANYKNIRLIDNIEFCIDGSN